MSLFKHLDDRIFLPFSRKHRTLYERCLTEIYDAYYNGVVQFPTQQQIVDRIYETLKSNAELWSDDEAVEDAPELLVKGRRRLKPAVRTEAEREITDVVLGRAWHIYDYLLACGWIEEEKFGIRILADMTPGALALMEAFDRIRNGLSVRFTGTLTQLNIALEGLGREPFNNAPALGNVRRDLETFVRHLRAIIADLKRIRAQMAAGPNRRVRLKVFLEMFVKELLLKDFATLHTTNHPYRYKHETLQAVRRLSCDRHILAEAGRRYAEDEEPQVMQLLGTPEPRRAEALVAGERRVADDFAVIEQILGNIDELFGRIRAAQQGLEDRLRSISRYSRGGYDDFPARAAKRAARLAALIKQRPKTADLPLIEGPLEMWQRPFGVHQLREPSRESLPMKAAAIRLEEPDPADLLLQELRIAYQRRIAPDGGRLADWLDRKLGERQLALASDFPAETIDDFIGIDSILMLFRRGDLPPEVQASFTVGPAEDYPRVSNDYIECDNFRVTRKERQADAA